MAGVPNRQAWRAEEDARGDSALVQRMTAFGWVVHRHILPVGHVFTTYAKELVPRELFPNCTLYVKGRASVVHEDGTVIPDRVAGMYSGDRPDRVVGKITHTALEELEFWCFNWHANRRALPQVEVFRLADSEVFTAPAGQRVLLCFGSLGNYEYGTAFIHDGADLVATGDCYGFLIGANHG